MKACGADFTLWPLGNTLRAGAMTDGRCTKPEPAWTRPRLIYWVLTRKI